MSRLSLALVTDNMSNTSSVDMATFFLGGFNHLPTCWKVKTGHCKIWLCRRVFLSLSHHLSFPSSSPLSSNWPLVLQQGSNSSEIRGSTNLSVFHIRSQSSSFDHLLFLCPSVEYVQSSLICAAFCLDWTRGGGGWAPRRGSRKPLALWLVSPSPGLSLLPFSPTLLSLNRWWPCVLSLLSFTPWTHCCRTEPAAVAPSWSLTPSGGFLRALAANCGSVWACAGSYRFWDTPLPRLAGLPTHRWWVGAQRKRSGTGNVGMESQRH